MLDLGKCYQHSSGAVMKLLGEVETVRYGTAVVCEVLNSLGQYDIEVTADTLEGTTEIDRQWREIPEWEFKRAVTTLDTKSFSTFGRTRGIFGGRR